MRVKEESEKVGLKINITKTNITLCHIQEEKVETVTDFLFSWAPKSQRTVTAAMKLKDACSLEEKLW